MEKMMLGYIRQYNPEIYPDAAERFKFKECPFRLTVNSKGKRIYSKSFAAMDYDEVESDTRMLKENTKIMLVRTPVILDDALRERMIKWVEWANHANPNEYDRYRRGLLHVTK